MEDIMPELNVLIGGENFAEIRRGKYCYIDKTGGMAAVIEVKRTKNADELPSLVEKGMKQITDNKYDALLRAIPSVRTILHWSIAFCKKAAWQRLWSQANCKDHSQSHCLPGCPVGAR